MKTKDTILELLLRNAGQFISGEEISERLGVSRAAVWKAVNALREDGYEVKAVTRKGYALQEPKGGFISAEWLRQKCEGQYIGNEILVLEQVDSTNSYAKQMAEQPGHDGAVILAKRQMHGKGRLYRHFYSPTEEGVYLSVILKPNIHLKDLPLLTLTASFSVLQAVEELCGISLQVKWPNDLVWERKKVCGILTESLLETETGRVQSVVVGIGFNLNHHGFPDELQEIACSLYQITGKSWNREKLAVLILKYLDRLLQAGWYRTNRKELIAQYRKHLGFLGKEVSILFPKQTVNAKVLDVTEDGGLLIQENGKSKSVIYSGELKIKW